MTMKNMVVTSVLGASLLFGGVGYAQKKPAGAQMPAHNVSAKKHPNLAAAQRLTDQAYSKIVAAQKANEYDLEGHAQKAKELLDQANNELKQAAQASNQEKKEKK